MMDTFSVLAVLFLELGLGETLIDAYRGERVQWREGGITEIQDVV